MSAASGVKYGLSVRLHVKPGKEAEVEQFLKTALPLVQREAGTVTWYTLASLAHSLIHSLTR